MRPVLYRVFRKETNRMYPCASINLGNQNIPFFSVDVIDFEAGEKSESNILRLDRHEVELMQYTGLYDTVGTPIYEGDILKSMNDGMYLVSWRGASFVVQQFKDNPGDLLIAAEILDSGSITSRQLIVYGNTFIR